MKKKPISFAVSLGCRRQKAIRGIKKFFIRLCCCIKAKCVSFVEHRGRPPPKKDEIVKEIMAELERIEAGKPESVAGKGGVSGLRNQYGRTNPLKSQNMQ